MTPVADAVIGVSVIAFIAVFVTIAFRTALVADAISMIGRVLCPATCARLIDFAHLAALVAESGAVVLLSTFLTKFVGTALFNALRFILAQAVNCILAASSVLTVSSVLVVGSILAVSCILVINSICVHWFVTIEITRITGLSYGSR
jgi:hypothetical protein